MRHFLRKDHGTSTTSGWIRATSSGVRNAENSPSSTRLPMKEGVLMMADQCSSTKKLPSVTSATRNPTYKETQSTGSRSGCKVTTCKVTAHRASGRWVLFFKKLRVKILPRQTRHLSHFFLPPARDKIILRQNP